MNSIRELASTASATAAPTLIRGFVTPFLTSVIGVPVLISERTKGSMAPVGYFDLRIASAPATCGAAMDVPLIDVQPPLVEAERISAPGARTVTSELLFEPSVPLCSHIVSDLVEAPTNTAPDMQPGYDTPLVNALFPLIITGAIFAETRRAIACVSNGL